MTTLLAILLSASTPALTDGEIWNEGIGYYEAGDVTNAIRVLRPLMLSRTHSVRAAGLVAKLELERGNVEEAAAAAHIALMADPDDARADRNYTRATDGIGPYREEKRIESLLRSANGKDPSVMLLASARDARRLLAESVTYRTNAAEKVVALSDSMAKRAGDIVDTLVPVREAIAQSVTNEEQASTILMQIESAEKRAREAKRALADLNDSAYGALADTENDLTRFVKLTIAPPQAIEEDFICQSNAWQDVEEVNGRHWQNDALDFTRAFRAKFPAWARDYEQQAQSDTNKPPFTAEDQAKISALATEVEKLQIECCEKLLPPQQEEALDMIREIIGLLPKDGNGGGAGNGQNRQNQNEQNPNQNKQEGDQPQDEENLQQNENDQDQGEGNQGEEQEEDQPQESGAEDDGDEESDAQEDVEALLRKAQERNDEYEADKKARMRKSPLPPNERDW